jgi:hypothetical protein
VEGDDLLRAEAGANEVLTQEGRLVEGVFAAGADVFGERGGVAFAPVACGSFLCVRDVDIRV